MLNRLVTWRNYRISSLVSSRFSCRPRTLTQHFIQGQSQKEGMREYFYYIDHQGQLFLEGTKIQNFTTCFKDKKFLIFFFKRLQLNNTDRYQKDFPYISRCGREMNYIRCESVPIVFTDILEKDNNSNNNDEIVMNGIGKEMTLPFQPKQLCMLPRNGRVYHPASSKVGGAGILKTSLAIKFSTYFLFENGDEEIDPPSHFVWNNVTYTLTNELWEVMKHLNVDEDDED